MKKLLTSLLLAVALCGGLFMFQTGCATANLAAYKATVTTQVTVETAMTAWGDWIKQQDALGTPVSMDSRAKVKAGYEKYQAAAVLVADAGASYTQSLATTNASAKQAVLNTAIAMASGCLGDLVNLIRSFGVKI